MLRSSMLVLAVLVLGHDLTFLAASGLDGLGIALERSGHGAYWPFTWLVALAACAALFAIGAVGALRLGRRLPTDAAAAAVRDGLRSYARELLRIWPRIALAALLLFIAQEAAEHYLMHGGHVLQPRDFVSGAYAATLPAFAAASLLVAGIAALFARAIDALEEAVRRAAILPRPIPALPSPVLPQLARLQASLATPDIGRAPPLPLAR